MIRVNARRVSVIVFEVLFKTYIPKIYNLFKFNHGAVAVWRVQTSVTNQ